MVAKYVPFFFDLGGALSASSDGLICNPYAWARSKHTFPISHFFWKVASNRPHVGSILGAIFIKNLKFKGKRDFETLQTQTTPYVQASRQPPIACAILSTRRNTLSKKQQQLFVSESVSEYCCWTCHFWASSIEQLYSYVSWNLRQKHIRFQVLAILRPGDLTRSGPRPGELYLRSWSLFLKHMCS